MMKIAPIKIIVIFMAMGFETLSKFVFVEDLNSWERTTHEYQEN